jgi:hypothetical protein
MLPMNRIDPEPVAVPERTGPGMGVALLGGWLGGLALAGLVLSGGFGWLAALVAYVLGGAVLVLAIALIPLLDLPQPALRPVYVRVRRRS